MKKYLLLLMTLIFLALSACGSGEVENFEKEEAETKEKEEKVKIEQEKAEIEKERAKIKEEKDEIEEEKAKIEEEKTKIEEEKEKIEEEKTKVAAEENEETNDAGTKFDDLPLAIRVHLATTIVDERAEDDLTGYTLYYNIEGDKLYVQVHSGAGVGHPIYKIQIDSDSITPIEGIVNVSAREIEEDAVNSSTISKEDLYNNYSKHKNIYESGQINVEQSDHITESFEMMKDEIQ